MPFRRRYNRGRSVRATNLVDWLRYWKAIERRNKNRIVLNDSDDEDMDVDQKNKEKKIIDLMVTDVDLCIQNNGQQHNTSEYDIMERNDLVVRRGQTFNIKVSFNRKYNKDSDKICLVFTRGKKPIASDGSHVTLTLTESKKPNSWGAKLVSCVDKSVSITVLTPSDCAVSKWNMQVNVMKEEPNGKKIITKGPKRQVYILFNPWMKEDQVYMENAEWLSEYVMNENGVIFVGSKRHIGNVPWTFGQFEENILDCALYLLDKSSLPSKSRGDPVKIVRKLSAMGNCQDDNGVLVGNWSGDYSGGKSPLAWNGSVKILEEFYKTKEPVSYGQCWVFSGILTTLCRTLGIPTRSVTNFGSAHDTDGSVTIDYFSDALGEELDEMNSDSIWNFHVWNESWMTRPDLGENNCYGGWQAMDATPQEESDNAYQCGPMPLAAIKCGDILQGYDGPFIFGEVNADKVYWQMNEDLDMKVVKIVSNHVGNNISTKRVNGTWRNLREDITHQYKYPEGSPEERAAVMKANLCTKRQDIYTTSTDKVLEFKLIEEDVLPYGKEFYVKVQIKNVGKEKRTIGGALRATSMYYTGVPFKRIKRQSFENEVIEASTSRIFEMPVSFLEYFDKLAEHCHIQMSCIFHVTESNHTFVDDDNFQLKKPELTMKCPETATVNDPFLLEISFENPLSLSLSNCILSLEGAGIQKERDIKQNIVGANQTFMTSVQIIPPKKGKKEIMVTFNSTELLGVKGSCAINVK